ncbi:MAG TPA: uroporphyrinogen-III synthase [Gammaproteobacteria bacterium]
MTTPQRNDVPNGQRGRDASPGAPLAAGPADDTTRARLAGRKVLLTRSEEDSAVWARALEQVGVVPVTLPCIDAEPLGDDASGRALREAARAADWLVFTSRRGVEAFVRLAGGDVLAGDAALEDGNALEDVVALADGTALTDRDPLENANAGRAHEDTRTAAPDSAAAHGASRRRPRIAVVGPATAEAATRLLGRVDLVGEHGTAESLAESMLSAGARGTRVVLALAENARDVLETRLRAAGAECRRFDVYRTVPAAPQTPKLALSALSVDAVWLASPSAVEGFANSVDVDADVPLVAIGPSTAAAIRARGLAVAAEARTPSFEGLLEATR